MARKADGNGQAAVEEKPQREVKTKAQALAELREENRRKEEELKAQLETQKEENRRIREEKKAAQEARKKEIEEKKRLKAEQLMKEEEELAARLDPRAFAPKEELDKLPALFGTASNSISTVNALRNKVQIMEDDQLVELFKFAEQLDSFSWRTAINASYEICWRVRVRCREQGANVQDAMTEIAGIIGKAPRTLENDATLQKLFFMPENGKEDSPEEADILRQVEDAANVLGEKQYFTEALRAKKANRHREAIILMAQAKLNTAENKFFTTRDARKLVDGLLGITEARAAAYQAQKEKEAEGGEGEAPVQSSGVGAPGNISADALAFTASIAAADTNALETGETQYVWRDRKGTWGAYTTECPIPGSQSIRVWPDIVNGVGVVLLPGESEPEVEEAENSGEEEEQEEPDEADGSEFDWPEEAAAVPVEA